MLPGPRKDRVLGFQDFPTQSHEIWLCNELTVLQPLSLCTGGCLMLEAEQVDAGAGVRGLRTRLINSRVWSLWNASLDRQGLECFASLQKETYCPLKTWALGKDRKWRLRAQTDTQPCWQKLHFCNHFMHRTAFGCSDWAAPLWWAWTAGCYQQTELSKYPRLSSKEVTEQIKPLFIYS